MIWLLVFIFIIIIVIAFLWTRSKNCVKNCVGVHSEKGGNYPWLSDIHGGLNFIEFEEPSGSGVWRRYNDQFWHAHCAKISHDPDNLIEAHRRAFLASGSPIKLRFHWKDGTVENLQDIPEHHAYYQREADYFKKNGICLGQKNNESSSLAINP